MSSPKSSNPECFVYKCDGKFVDFVEGNPQYHNDIKSNIGKFAILNEVTEKKGIGKVRVTLKPVS